MTQSTCFHCGDPCAENLIRFEEKSFCCNGCKTVYQIFSENDLVCYYDLENAPGTTPAEIKGKFEFLDDNSIKEKQSEFHTILLVSALENLLRPSVRLDMNPR